MATQLTQVTFPNGDYIKDTNTTYSAGTGLSLSGTTFNVNNSTILPFEANLAWGGKNFSASYGCIDAALMDELGANRFQFIKASAITVEYSRDGGSTWTDYGATDTQKQQIFAQGGGLIIGKADSTNKATEHPGLYQLRITIDTGVAGVYSYLNKFIVYVSSSGSANCACKIQKALQSTPTTFVDHTDWISVGGWSGYNVLNTNYLPTYGNSPSGQYGRVRFIFKDGEGGNTNYIGLSILQIKAFGGVGWNTPSTMAKTGHIYSYDQNQNAFFPAIVSARTFTTTTEKSMPIVSGKCSELATGTTRIYKDGIVISNPTTANDQGWIRVLGTGESDTIMEIATGDDGGVGEQIVVRQYNTSSTIVNEATLLDKSGNTTFPKDVTATKFIGALQGNADTATTASKLGSSNVGSATQPIYLNGGTATACTYTLGKSVPSDAVFTDTKNTAGSTDTSSKIFLIGATSQAANPQTYSQDTAYVGTDGCLYSGGTKVLTAHQDISGKADKATTLAGYGITDAKISNGTITLGSNTITPLTSSSTLNAAKLSGTIPSSCYTDTNNAVTQSPTDSTNATYELLFSSSADNTEHTEGTRKSKYATFNPGKEAFTFGTRKSNSSIGSFSIAEGYNVVASGTYSHAEGGDTIASRDCSHAEGLDTVASGDNSHTEGLGTAANHRSQHVFGEYNVLDASTADYYERGNYIEIVGNGTADDTRSNARTLDWSGNEWLAGSLTAHFVHSLNVGDGSASDNSSINAKNTNVTLSYNNRTNGITSNRYSLFNALDSNNTRYGYVQFGAYTNGNVSASLRAVNAPYGASQMAQNSLDITIDKDGNCTYAVSDKDAFKTALGLTDIGKVYTASVSKSITSTDINSPIEGATVTLPKGSYVIFGQWVFNSLSPINQQRITRCCIKNKTAGTILTEQRICQAAGNYCVVQCMHIVAFSASTNVCVAGGANITSGNGATYIAAIKISD